DGGITAGDDKARVDLCVRYLKENAPASVRLENEHLQLLPWGDKEDFLDICSYKTYELQLCFQPTENATAGENLLRAFNGYLRFWCDPSWASSTRAWGDFGYVAVPDAKLAEQIKRRFRPYTLTGWRDLGSTPEFESGSSSAPGGGYEPLIKTAPFYLGYLQTNDRRQFDQLERTSWHWRDRRYIYLDGDWSDKSWAGRGGVYYAYYAKGVKDFPDVQPPTYQRYSGSWNYGGRYGPMDTQHFSVDEVVNYYYLTGDRQCLEALQAYGKQAASFCGAFARAEKAKVGREHGWVTRALISIYEATGDKKLLDLARGAVRAIITNQDKTAGCISDVNEKAKDPQTGAMVPARHTPFMNAAVAMALGRYYRHHPEEDVRDAILGIADWLCYDVAGPAGGFSYTWTTENPGARSVSGHRCMSTMAWAYLATGHKRYLDAADKHAGKLEEWYQSGFGQEYVYIKTTPRPDPVPPAPVTDLSAEALGNGKVRLTWTAPGDDGRVGRAAEYQVKYSAKEIKEHADWRNRADVEISFWAATNCKGEPKPGEAGTKEMFVLEGLEPGMYSFALKTYDEQPNQSDLSNVVKVQVK
ncbi:MAG: glycoside hydrolase family 127 protein, partial [Kiritimatiellae bacterium]|nr:glycoside hydrolase family 127 protein [Kiritimatiellia bacterium]